MAQISEDSRAEGWVSRDSRRFTSTALPLCLSLFNSLLSSNSLSEAWPLQSSLSLCAAPWYQKRVLIQQIGQSDGRPKQSDRFSHSAAEERLHHPVTSSQSDCSSQPGNTAGCRTAVVKIGEQHRAGQRRGVTWHRRRQDGADVHQRAWRQRQGSWRSVKAATGARRQRQPPQRSVTVWIYKDGSSACI